MEHLPTLVLGTTISTLLAVDTPLPVEASALIMVGLILRFLLHRDQKSHEKHNERLTAIEMQLEDERLAKDEQRALKHALRNEITAMRATIAMMIPLARSCSCNAVEPLLPVLERLAIDTKESTP